VGFEYIAQHKQPPGSGKPAGGVALTPITDSGADTVRDHEMVPLDSSSQGDLPTIKNSTDETIRNCAN